MSAAKAPPIIFDEDALAQRRLRAEKRGESFLMDRCLADLIDRLQDVNRNFENVLIYGSQNLGEIIKSKLPDGKIQKTAVCETLSTLPSDTNYDLVISLLRLQSLNDLPGGIIRLSQRLKADGLFIGAMFGGDTLTELRQVFYAVDEAQLGRISAHIYPMVTYTQVGSLLARAGLNQPVIDTDRFTVSYKHIDTLVSDLRDLGETNILSERAKVHFSRSYKKALEAAYKGMFSTQNRKLACSFEILWLTGWKPHESQQKPLKPGSAKTRLADSLRNISKDRQ